jgi:hypothetical protein
VKVERFWDCEGVPVVETVNPDGSGSTLALDGSEPRKFPVDSLYRNGAAVSPKRFKELFPAAASHLGL